MNLKSLSHLIHLLRSAYCPDFEFEKSLLNTLSNSNSEYFKQFFPPQDDRLSLPSLIQGLTSALEPNDRYLELNNSGDWTLFLAAILHDRPIAACMVQTNAEQELNFEDPRLLNLPDPYLEAINLLQVEPGVSLSTVLMDLQEAESNLQTAIETAIVLLPTVENYRLHFLNLLTIAPTLPPSALILTLGANYPWIKQANQDFLDFYAQSRLILDLSLKNNTLGTDVLGLQVIGWGQDWVDFYTENIDFNPHYLQNLITDKNITPYGLESVTFEPYQALVQDTLQTVVQAHQQGDREQAQFLYHQVLKQDINQDLAWANLGTIAFENDDRKEALQFTYSAALINPKYDLYWRNLGLNYQRSRDFRQSIYFFEKALTVNDRLALNYLSLAKVLEQSNDYKRAHLVLERGLEQCPGDLVLYIKQMLLKPLIYKNLEEIQAFHDRLTENLQIVLDHLQTQRETVSQLTSSQIYEILDALDLAYIAYQGMDLVPIAKTIAGIISSIVEITQPNLRELIDPQLFKNPSLSLQTVQDRPVISRDRKIKVGYLGTCLKDHSVGFLARGWVQFHDRNRFEVFCYSINAKHSPADPIASTFEHYSDRFYLFSSPGMEVIKKILEDQIDILVFIDLNVGSKMTYLSVLRLAPIQCGFWGNPMTSGSTQIDYFLSSQLMESWQAQSHYTEKLVYLPDLASCCIEEAIDLSSLDPWGTTSDSVTYLFTQTLLKHLPQYDYIFAAIAQRVPSAHFMILAQPDEYLAQAFLDRLEGFFADYNLDLKHYCQLLPVMPKPKFYALQSSVDVVLDSLGWSGGITTLDAINCTVPIVTYPGEFMRGRHSYAILQLLGVTETIAHSEQEYIDIAVQLGNDRSWREQIRQKIQHNKPKLYGTQTCVRGLENFYQYAYNY